MKKLLPYLRPYRLQCVLAPLFKMLEACAELFVPLVMTRIIDRGIPAGDTAFILKNCLLLVLLGLAGLGFTTLAQYFSARAASGFAADVRQALFGHIMRLSYAEYDVMGAATLITRMTSDMNQVQTGLNLTLRLLLRSPFVVFGAMVMAFTVDVKAAVPFAVAIPILFAVVFAIMLSSIPMYRSSQKKLDRVMDASRENLSGVRVVRAFCMQDREEDDFRARTQELLDAQLRVGRISALLNPATYVIINLAIVAVLRTGAVRVEFGALTQGQVVALYNYMSQILVELIKFANLILNITRALACADRVSQMLSIQPGLTDGQKRVCAAQAQELVRFEHVSFRYPGALGAALQDISFSLQAGQTLGVIGGTGSGKTTLINLIARFYDASEGQVLFAGCDVRAQTLASLRAQIGLVPQKSLLFTGSIRENLLWGNREASEQTLAQALDAAQARDVIASKPDGLEAAVEAGGRNFSGGQRQRLCIARALVRKPALLILDDSASALDYATDAALRKALRTLAWKPGAIIVSQRTASIRHADQILVLEDGRCAGLGTHETLLETCPVYREIHESQYKKEEAAQ